MGTADKGMFRWDPATGQSTHYENEPGNPESISSNYIYKLKIDRDQNVWVITNKGLSRLKKKRVDFHSYRKVSNVTSDVVPMYVTGIHFVAGKTANYLVTTSGESGIWTTSFDRNALGSLRFQPLEFKEKPENFDYIQDIEKRRDAFWVVCSRSYNKGSLFKLPINAQTGLPEGRVIQRLFRDEKNPRSLGGFISAGIQKDEQENFWMGITICNCNQTIGVDTVIDKTALDKVVFTEEGEVDTVLHFRHDPKDPNSLISERLIGGGGVWRTYPEGKDSRWVATTAGIDLFRNGRFEHVLNQYSNWVSKCSDGTILAGAWGKGLFEGRKEGDHYRFTKVEALGDQSIEAIEEDRLGRLWIGTHRGLFLYNRAEQMVQEFGPEDGVQGDRFISSTQTPDGIMIFGGENGLTLFDPMSFHLNEIRPQPLIRQLKVNNKPAIVEGHPSAPADFIIPQNIGSLPELVLDHTSNLFTLEFAAMELTNPEKNLYAYKLEGAKGDWVQTDWKNRSVTYMNLNAGTYTFRVKATNADGIWSDRETTLAIRVLPPPWKTWWAYTLYFLTVTGSTWYYIKSRERSLRKRQVELEQTVTERTADVVAEKKEVEKQRNRSDELLLNILPSEIAEELKQTGSTEAKQFDNVTVMFTDFKNFTQISEKLTPAELVAEIHSCFKAFDNIITKYNIEKIKTIGDSYMCVLPVPNETHASDVVNAALEILQFIKQNAEQRRKEGKERFEIRIGVNTGPVVAGIVGIKKFAYDIWGDTVNIASRMESGGESGRVNISQSTYERVKDNPDLRFEPRGKIEAKHKGEIEMYFVSRNVFG